eukprot:1453078-Amphidinium_carterae.1
MTTSTAHGSRNYFAETKNASSTAEATTQWKAISTNHELQAYTLARTHATYNWANKKPLHTSKT